MNIKKRIRLEANDKIAHLIREKYARPNVYANKNNKGMLLIISFCSLIVTALIPFSIVGIKALLSTSNNNYSSRSSPDQGGSYVKPWIERSIFQKYPILVYEDNYYSISSEYNFQFPNEKVGIEISDSATISSKDYQSNENHEEVVRLFSIEKIDTRVAILVKFKSDVNYYPYCSVDAYFNSLDELLNGYDLYNSISFDNSFFIYKSKNSIYRYAFV